MKVSTTQPFQIVYSVFEHEFLGHLFEAFVVQLNTKNELTYQYQNISFQNAQEFSKGLDEVDFQLIQLMDMMRQDYIIKKFYNKKVKPFEFFAKVYPKDKEKGEELLRNKIDEILEERRQKIIHYIRQYNKQLFVMGKDGNPIWKQMQWEEEPATVLFHFRRNEEGTNYFPTIKFKDERLDFQYKNAFILGRKPAWLGLGNQLFSFAKDVDGKKLQPFLNKKFIAIPPKMEEQYYEKFVAPLVAAFDVYAIGFEIKTVQHEAKAVLGFTEFYLTTSDLFDNRTPDYKIQLDLSFQYGDYQLKFQEISEKHFQKHKINVYLEKNGDNYKFYRIRRDLQYESSIIKLLHQLGLEIKKGTILIDKGKAFKWISTHAEDLLQKGVLISQNTKSNKKYFLGKAEIDINIEENNDWFDIFARIRFGEFEIPFVQLRKLILQRKTEFTLPNGEIAVIPDIWLEQYAELFAFTETDETHHHLQKHHLSILDELKNGNFARIKMNRKLEQFKDFEEIEDTPLPKYFEGELRPYQKAGYNWLQFLNKYKFGGCLADDMGLGKTIMTLAMLQSQKEKGIKKASLLIIPTSLIYNWELEAQKFTPKLKIFIYTGTTRKKVTEHFDYYDLVITSYGIARLDMDILKKYMFHYIILDESQAIKNPASNVSQAVKQLNSQFRLILTGTPLENSILDLWSQMSFINPGLLGTNAFFKNEFITPIEKKQDADKLQKLAKMIKPFILRRLKSQVATDLPEKIENIQYCLMTESQEQEYEKVKAQYRNEILKHIDQEGIGRSQFLLLQGLTKLRQIANHPKMIDKDYQGDSGKLEDVRYKLESIMSEKHKVLVFSQFVKHLDILRKYLDEKNWQYAYLDGATKNRQAEVEKFQKDEQIKIFLISLKAGGVGLNLTAAEYVFLLDPWWNPAIEAQAVDRAHRIGQKNTVFTYKFITKNTVEEKILALQRNKKLLADEIITTEESFIKHLSKEDVLNLLD